MEQREYRELDQQQRRARLFELFCVFFRLGTVAFGGPAAHTAMMEEEVVTCPPILVPDPELVEI